MFKVSASPPTPLTFSIIPPHKDGGYGPTFARNLLTQTVSIHERGRIIANLHTLNLIFSGLVSGSHYFPPTVDGELLSFWSVIRDRKHANLAEPVLDLVERLTRRKDSTNQVSFQSAHYAAAMIDYCLILCDLYPWTATPLLFTSKDAFELGVAQLEASLWSNMSVTALHLAKSTGDNGWLHVAQGTAAAVYNMRFATSKLLARAYWRECRMCGLADLKAPPMRACSSCPRTATCSSPSRFSSLKGQKSHCSVCSSTAPSQTSGLTKSATTSTPVGHTSSSPLTPSCEEWGVGCLRQQQPRCMINEMSILML